MRLYPHIHKGLINKVKGCSHLPLKKISFFAILLTINLLIGTQWSYACTCWAVAGEYVEGGGTLIAKNRDYLPQKNEIRLTIPETGYIYLGLYPIKDQGEQGIVAGINEKGLAVVSMTADSIPSSRRHVGKNIISHILSSYVSVDEAIKDENIFSKTHPSFYMMADNTRIALVEIGPDGTFSIRNTDNGILFHTNHYTDEKFLVFNEKISKSSQIRLNRIGELLKSHPSYFTIEDFIIFSEDRINGPNNSIWRTGDSHVKKRTLASWIISIPKTGSSEIYVKIANPGEPERFYNMKLDKPFWTNGLE